MHQIVRITSAQNSHLRHAARLRSARTRVREKLFLIDGEREIRRAGSAGVEIVECFVSDDQQGRDFAASIADMYGDACSVYQLSESLLAKLSYGDRANSPVALATTPEVKLPDTPPRAGGLIAVLEGIEKPGNVGAILRTANAAGVDAVIVADGATDLFNPNAIRASTGAIFDTPIFSGSSVEVFDWLTRYNVSMLAARVDAHDNHVDVRYDGLHAIILGSEANGLSPVWESVRSVRIPMSGTVDSLNVSVTAAILLYEARRQRST